jgi:hypothetical protein
MQARDVVGTHRATFVLSIRTAIYVAEAQG